MLIIKNLGMTTLIDLDGEHAHYTMTLQNQSDDEVTLQINEDLFKVLMEIKLQGDSKQPRDSMLPPLAAVPSTPTPEEIEAIKEKINQEEQRSNGKQEASMTNMAFPFGQIDSDDPGEIKSDGVDQL